VLESQGYVVLSAASGEEALRVLESAHVDLVLSDHYLRGELGTAVAAKMKALKPGVPVVILSGAVDRLEGIENADGFLSKESDVPDLLVSVARYLKSGLSAGGEVGQPVYGPELVNINHLGGPTICLTYYPHGWPLPCPANFFAFSKFDPAGGEKWKFALVWQDKTDSHWPDIRQGVVCQPTVRILLHLGTHL